MPAPAASPLKRQQVFTRLNAPVKTRDDLLRLFVTDLGYQRVERPIPVTRETFGEGAALALAQQCRPIRLAEAGGFHIIHAEFDGDHLDLGRQRLLASKLLETFPDSLFTFARASTFGDPRGAEIHLVNARSTPAAGNLILRRFKLGPSERYRTTAERLAFLDLTETPDLGSLAIRARHDAAFDVEPVARQFFADYCDVFEIVAHDIANRHHRWTKETVEHQAQTLLNRLLFLYFIQRKGWLNRQRDFLAAHSREHFQRDPQSTSFLADFLRPVFVKLSTKGSQADIAGLDLPFLNGGLFADEYGAEQRDDEVRRHHDLKVGNDTFQHVFDDLLETYNFTVREDTPLDIEVAIDPEMLGKIFESLVLQLEQSGTGGKSSRHDTGSHYTPRPYVHYLCRNGLAAWLEDQPPLAGTPDARERIARLLAIDASNGIDDAERATLDSLLTPQQARALADRLYDLRACDPGVGSGAFPVALLHELVNLARLCETRARGKDPVAADPHWLFTTKTRFIERCLYGVDLQERAIEICKLRLWLSLVVDYPLDVDADTCERHSFRDALKRLPALPNLDFKIRRANSLVDMIRGEPVPLGRLHAGAQAQVALSRLITAKREFYRADSVPEKRRLCFAIYHALAELAQIELTAARNELGLIPDPENAEKVVELDHGLKEMAWVLAQIRDARKMKAADQEEALERLRARFDDAKKPTFVWQLDFAEVFHRDSVAADVSWRTSTTGELGLPAGEESDQRVPTSTAPPPGGFDVIVGNPPYISKTNFQKAAPTDFEVVRTHYETAQGRDFDLFGCFIERSVTLLKPQGILGFIVAAGWYTGPGFELLRRFVATRTDPRVFVNLPYDVFESAWVDTTIFMASSRQTPVPWPRREPCLAKLKNFHKREKITSAHDFETGAVFVDISAWFSGGADLFLTRSDSAMLELLDRIRAASRKLGSLADIQRGVTPFVLTEKAVGKSSKAAFAGTVRRYLLERGLKRFVRFDDSLAEPKPERYFVGPRLLLRELISRQFRLQATYVEEDFVTNKSMQTLLPLPDGPPLKFLLGCLNSRLLSWFFLQRSNVGHRDDFPKIVLKETRELPIANATPEQEAEIADLVERILTAKRATPSADTTALEREIDARVYRLYALTPAEIKLVEDSAS